jgi:hypothetical protein
LWQKKLEMKSLLWETAIFFHGWKVPKFRPRHGCFKKEEVAMNRRLNLGGMLCALFALALVGCGGSSGGSGGGGNGVEAISYTGNTSPASVTVLNAEDLAVGSFLGANIGTSVVALGVASPEADPPAPRLSWPIHLPSLFETAALDAYFNGQAPAGASSAIQTVEGSESGTCGGKVTYVLQVDDVSGDFTGTFTFDDFCEGGIKISGRATAEGSVDLGMDEIEQLSVTFSNLSSAGIVIQGFVSVDAAGVPEIIEMDYLAKDKSSGKVYWVNDFRLLVTEKAGFVEVEASGGCRYYDHDSGYVDVATSEPFVIFEGDDYPSSGALVCTGENNTKARMTCIDNASFRIEADTDGNDSYETDLGVYLWSDF